MRLTPLQWAWMAGVTALFGAALLDIAGVIAPPNALWAFGPLILLLIGWLVPSMRELRRAQRRGGRQS